MDTISPCACATSTYYRCAWCPEFGHLEGLAEEYKCHCQLHWIVFPQLHPGRQGPHVQGGLGLGICRRCDSRCGLQSTYNLTVSGLLESVRRLDASTRVAREHLQACLDGAVTQEVEVQGNFALSSSVDDRTGVRVWVQVGRRRSPSTNTGRSDTTVEYSITPSDENIQRYVSEGFRTVNRTFDWDRPDRYNEDLDIQEVDEEWQSGAEADHA
jgi:hypothetical protein